MVTFDVLYIFDFALKAFGIWLVMGIALVCLLCAMKNRKCFLYIMVFTLIYLCSSLTYLYGHKLYMKAFLNEQKESLMNAKLVQAKYELYDPSGELKKRTHNLSTSEIKNMATIFSDTEWQKRPNLGIPSSNHRIKLFYGSQYDLLFTIYDKDIIMMNKYTFKLNNTKLWNFLTSLTNDGKLRSDTFSGDD